MEYSSYCYHSGFLCDAWFTTRCKCCRLFRRHLATSAMSHHQGGGIGLHGRPRHRARCRYAAPEMCGFPAKCGCKTQWRVELSAVAVFYESEPGIIGYTRMLLECFVSFESQMHSWTFECCTTWMRKMPGTQTPFCRLSLPKLRLESDMFSMGLLTCHNLPDGRLFSRLHVGSVKHERPGSIGIRATLRLQMNWTNHYNTCTTPYSSWLGVDDYSP